MYLSCNQSGPSWRSRQDFKVSKFKIKNDLFYVNGIFIKHLLISIVLVRSRDNIFPTEKLTFYSNGRFKSGDREYGNRLILSAKIEFQEPCSETS